MGVLWVFSSVFKSYRRGKLRNPRAGFGLIEALVVSRWQLFLCME